MAKSSFGGNMKGSMAGNGSKTVKYSKGLQKARGGVRPSSQPNPYTKRIAKAGEG